MTRPWYKRNPKDALNGMMKLTLEEKGAYNVVLDMLHLDGGPIEDDERCISRFCGCSIRKWRTVRDRLIALGKIVRTAEGRILDVGMPHSAPDRPPISGWAALRNIVFKRDDFTCRYCGTKDAHLECDHIHPVSRGGSSDLSNLATACRRCNRSKSNLTIGEWRHGRS